MALASQSFLFHSSGGERSEGGGEGGGERRTKEVGVEEEAVFFGPQCSAENKINNK